MNIFPQPDTIESIAADFERLEKAIPENYKAWNTEGVWLFLTTLSCWSVSSKPMAIFAVVLAAFVFVNRLWDALSMKGEYPRHFSDLLKRTSSLPTETDAERRAKAGIEWRIRQLSYSTLSKRAALRRGLVFAACWLFYGFTALSIFGKWPISSS